MIRFQPLSCLLTLFPLRDRFKLPRAPRQRPQTTPQGFSLSTSICIGLVSFLALGLPASFASPVTAKNQTSAPTFEQQDESKLPGHFPQQSNQRTDSIDPKTRDLGGDDERLRPKEQRQVHLGETLLSITGALRFDTEFQDNFNLRTIKEQDRLDLGPALNLNFIFDFPQGFTLFTEFRLEDQVRLEEMRKPMNTFQFQVQDFFINALLPFSFPTILRLGRQQFFESRRWYLNDRADAIRLLFDPNSFHVDVSFFTPVPDTGQRVRFFDNIFQKRRQRDVMLNASFSLTPDSEIGGYILVGNNHRNLIESGNPREGNPIWVGFRILGREKVKIKLAKSDFFKKLLRPKIRYWLDTAFVTGKVNSQTIRGFGLDIGATYIMRKLSMEPYFTLAYAFGSGDSNPHNGTDHNFRQTGFQGNSGKFGGVVNLDYYGVLFDPELSNLHVYTAGLGFRPTPKSSIDFIYHHYEQVHSFDEFRDAEVEDPGGQNRHIGDEIDIVIGYREIKNVRFRFRNGYFMPGPAYRSGRDDPAFLTKFDVQFSF